MDQTLPFKLYTPVHISSKKTSFTASSSGPSHFGGEQIYNEIETPGNEAASSMFFNNYSSSSSGLWVNSPCGREE